MNKRNKTETAVIRVCVVACCLVLFGLGNLRCPGLLCIQYAYSEPSSNQATAHALDPGIDDTPKVPLKTGAQKGMANRLQMRALSEKLQQISVAGKGSGRKIVEMDSDFAEPVISFLDRGRSSGKGAKEADSVLTKGLVRCNDGRISFELYGAPLFLEDKASPPASARPEESPFGISGIDGYHPLLADLGISWVRYMGPAGIVWDAVEPRKGFFDWHRNDQIYSATYGKHINMVVTILTPNRWDQGILHGRPKHRFPVDVDAYKAFLKGAVERYDGDGVDDAPGSPIVDFWQIENECDLFWEDTPENYARLVKISYEIIKGQNKNAEVVLSGVGMPKGLPGFYLSVFEHLKRLRDNPEDRYFDVFDFHWIVGGSGRYKMARFPGSDNTDFKRYVESINSALKEYGYDVPIWITEMASHSGAPRRGLQVPVQSERDQAAELIKRFIYPLSLGIQKVFWSTLVETHGFGDQLGVNDYFDLVGLIHNPANSGMDHKKLSYYAYKMMVEKLRGFDVDKIRPVHVGEGIEMYRFSRDGASIYVCWDSE